MSIYNKDEIKSNLTLNQIEDIVSELGGEPRKEQSYLICKTICHGGSSHKLYYYDNTKLFKCYTDCSDTFDIFELVCKIKNRLGEKKYTYQNGERKARNWVLPDAVEFVAIFFNIIENSQDFLNEQSQLQDWKIFEKYAKNLNNFNSKKIVDLKIYNDNFLKNLPHPKIIPWLKEKISQEVIDKYGICYDPRNQGIVIPHYDINIHLIGVRERTLIQEEEAKGKYKPAIINGIMYNHPLGFNLYNINNSKDNIKAIKKVIVFESEKSCLKYASYFGIDNDISVACCGSNLIAYQFALLLSLGVEEIIIGFDRQYKDIGDNEWKIWTKKLYGLYYKYSAYVKISFLFDMEHRLEYKNSPIDQGKELFLTLFKERIFI